MKLSHLIVLLTSLPRVISQSEAQTYLSSTSTDDTSCHQACAALQRALPTLRDISPAKPSYYTTQQSSIVPACTAYPLDTHEVSIILQVLSIHECHFAVKSGGHALFAGASNAEGGVTIDLKLLNKIEVLEGGDVTRVGTGNRWNDVYAKLAPLGKSVVGGRNGDVGVGGFLLGGGISFLSRRHGWACDNVLSFTLVLPNGTISTVTSSSSPSLFLALRGGGSNFGIVTSFDLATYEQGQVWGGSNLYLLKPAVAERALAMEHPMSPIYPKQYPVWWQSALVKIKRTSLKSVFKTICLFNICTTPEGLVQAFSKAQISSHPSPTPKAEDDPAAQLILALSWAYEAYISMVTLVHSAPPASPPNLTPWVPDTFRSFMELPRVWNTNKVQNFTSIYEELGSMNVAGYRQLWGAISFYMDEKLVEDIINIWIQEMEGLKGIKDIQPSIVFQPLYPEFITHSKTKGGNAMGLEVDPSKGMLILFSLAFRWSSSSDDTLVHTAGERIYERAEALAAETGRTHPFVYQNYAGAEQDVFAGYGAGMRARLREVQREVDPEGVWRRLRRGYFTV